MIKRTSAKAIETKAKRNAQTVCGLYNNARTIGVIFESPSKAGIVNELVKGVSNPETDGANFEMTAISGSELVEMLRYCHYDPRSDRMQYNPNGAELLEVVLVQSGTGVGPIMEREDIGEAARRLRDRLRARLQGGVRVD